MWQFLLEHSGETVAVISKIESVSKYDTAIAELIGKIGSPHADCCAEFLVWLVADPNAPARKAATTALFSLSNEAIIAGTRKVAATDDGALDIVLWEGRQRGHPVAIQLALENAKKSAAAGCDPRRLVTPTPDKLF